MKLSVFTKATNESGTFVSCIRLEEPGINDIVSTIEVETHGDIRHTPTNQIVIAELIAIQHVLFHTGYHVTPTLKTVSLATSSGRVKKAIQGKGDADVLPYAAPIALRVESLAIKVNNQQPSWFTPNANTRIRCGRMYSNTHIPAMTPMGELLITATAVNQFAGEEQGSTTGRDLKALIRTLNKRMEPTPITSTARQKKLTKYGQKAMATEHWTSDKNAHVFVVQKSRSHQTLVTCFPKCG